MDSQIVAIFCLCDDILKKIHHHEDRQCKMSDAEFITTSIVASSLLLRMQCGTSANVFERARLYSEHARNELFQLPPASDCQLFLIMFNLLAEELNEQSIYVLDSFPVAACDNYRVPRSRRYRGEAWRGYQASKKRYFYGLSLHLMVTGRGASVEFFLKPDSWSDTRAYSFLKDTVGKLGFGEDFEKGLVERRFQRPRSMVSNRTIASQPTSYSFEISSRARE